MKKKTSLGLFFLGALTGISLLLLVLHSTPPTPTKESGATLDASRGVDSVSVDASTGVQPAEATTAETLPAHRQPVHSESLAPRTGIRGEVWSLGTRTDLSGDALYLDRGTGSSWIWPVAGGRFVATPGSVRELGPRLVPAHWLLALENGLRIRPHAVTLTEDAGAPRLIIELGPPITLKILTLDLRGEPVGGVRITTGPWGSLSPEGVGQTDASGSAILHLWQGAGRIRLRLVKNGYQRESVLVNLSDAPQEQVVQMKRILVAGLAWDASLPVQGLGVMEPGDLDVLVPRADIASSLRSAERRCELLDTPVFQWYVFGESKEWSLLDALTVTVQLDSSSSPSQEIFLPIHGIDDPALRAEVVLPPPGQYTPRQVVHLRLLGEGRLLAPTPPVLFFGIRSAGGTADAPRTVRAWQGPAGTWTLILPAGGWDLVSASPRIRASGLAPRLAHPVSLDRLAATRNSAPIEVPLHDSVWCLRVQFLDEFGQTLDMEAGLFGEAAGDLVAPSMQRLDHGLFLERGINYQVLAATEGGRIETLAKGIVLGEPPIESPWVIVLDDVSTATLEESFR